MLALVSCENPVSKETKTDTPAKPKPNVGAPTISAISDVSFGQDGSTTVSYTIADSDSALSCQTSIYLTSTNNSLLPPTSMVRGGSAPNCTLRLAPPSGYWGTSTVRVQVYDGTNSAYSSFNVSVSEGTPTAIVSNTSANEGSNAVFTVQLTQASPLPKSVTYATSNGTASAGVHYTSTSGTLTFAAGETSKTVSVPTISDGIYAPNKTFSLSVTAIGISASATGTVVNTDAAPTASASDVSANEGSSLAFTVNLNRASETSTTVTYATADATALAGVNYTAASGTLTFLAGETSKTVTISSADDGVYTPNLTFSLGMTANSTTNTATGTINNTNGAPVASASSPWANEGSTLSFTVTLDRASSSSTSVTYATSNGTAASGTNYTTTSGTLTFTAGQTSKTVTVPSQVDGVHTGNLNFTLSVTANSVTNTGTGTIVNTDAAPVATASNASANEGSNITFTVNLNRASSSTQTVAYSMADGTAVDGTNYTAASGNLTFNAGETSKTLTVATLDDNVYTGNLNFTLSLTANSTTNTATGTVNNTNTAPTASAANVSANEGSNLVFTVALNRASSSTTSVTYATSNGTAIAGTNYTSASGTLTFAAGETSKTVTITSAADGTYTADLTFTLSMTANSTTNTATGTVVNTEGAPTASTADVSANEGSNLTFTVNLNRPSASSTSVTYATANGTASAGTNYTATSGTLTFLAGETSKTVSVPSTNDGVHTANLTFTFDVTANSVTDSSTGTINNTNAAPTASASNVSANEGSNLVFTVNLNRASSSSQTVTYATSDGTAAAGTNYTDTSGTLTFLAGETSKTVTVPSSDDGTYAANLTFTLSLTANSTTNTATGTVVNTNAAPTASASNESANEGSNLVFTVTLDRPSTTSTSVTYATVGNTAFAGTNYTAASGTLTFTAGQTSKTVTVTSLADSTYTPNLTFSLNVTANSVTNSGTGTVVNTDAAPIASVANASANEGSDITFTVSLNRPSSSSTSVTYASSDGTALAGTNYTAVSGTLSFAAGETSKTITVNTAADGTYTSNLGFTMSVTANSTTNTGTGTVVNTEAAPTASASAASANEGSDITFTVNLNRPSASSTSVTYATSNGTAASGTNYTAASGTLTFAAGETSKTVTVNTTDDSTYTPNLTFTLSMTANSTTNTATGTVINTQAAPTASASNVAANEGSNLVFTVTLSRASSASTTVAYATVGNTAFAGTNYTATSGNLTFAAGETSKTVTVASLADGVYTPNLTFDLTLTANSVTNTAVGTVNNTDAAPTASASNVAANEGSDLTFTVNLNRASSTTTSVTYATSNGTAASGTNYTAASGTLSFAAGETSKTVTVSSLADGVHTGNLTFTLSMTANSTTNTATGTVNNTDTAPTATASAASANEGSDLTFTVTLNRSSSSSQSVSYSTSNGTAIAGTNYTSTSGTLTFNAGETSKTVTVSSLSDSVHTSNLTFTLSMTVNSTTNTATGTVVNTDTAPTATAANVSANEGSGLTFTVTLNRASSSTQSVTYATSDGTALAGVNYTAKSGTLSFAAGETTKTVTVTSLDDNVHTGNLTFTLSMTANSTTNTATGTVTNTNSAPMVSIAADASSVTEGNGAGFTITLSRASSSAVTVDYATSNGTASAGSDYTSTSGTATIGAGSLTTTVSVPTTDDNSDEQDEAFTITLTNPANATLGTASASETIQDTTLYFSFLSGSLPSGLTFSRSSTATYFDSAGVLQTASSGTPRFDHDPSACAGTCAVSGLLVEETRTNLLLQSAAINSSWVATNATVAANAEVSPSGATNAESVASNTNALANTDNVSQSVSVAASTTYTLSFFVKNSSSTQSRFELNAGNSGTTGKISTITWAGAVPSLSAGSVKSVGNDWYRVWLTFTTNASDAGAATVAFYPSNSGADNAGEVILWGAQLEAGTTVSSYIPTTASMVTRAADGLSINNFANWFNATTWTAVLDFNRAYYEPSSATTTPTLFSSCDDTSGGTCTSDHFEATYYPSDNTFRGTAYVSSSNVASSDYTNAANFEGVNVQAAVSQSSSGEIRTVVNGTAATLSAGASTPILHHFAIGASGKSGSYTKQLNGHLRKFTYRARALTAAQMQAITSD